MSMLCFYEQVTVAEHLPAGSAVITVTATDRDSGENGKITYRVMSSTRGVFYIDPNNGEITVCTFKVVYSLFLTRSPCNHGLFPKALLICTFGSLEIFAKARIFNHFVH